MWSIRDRAGRGAGPYSACLCCGAESAKVHGYTADAAPEFFKVDESSGC